MKCFFSGKHFVFPTVGYFCIREQAGIEIHWERGTKALGTFTKSSDTVQCFIVLHSLVWQIARAVCQTSALTPYLIHKLWIMVQPNLHF